MKLIRIFTVLLASMLVLAACGNDKDSLDPPKINYGVDMAEMGMPVVDPRFTVATLPEGTSNWLLFDDIGEFLKYHQHKSSEFQVMWVPDHDSEDWVKAEDAWYVQADEFCYSPMRWCVAAFETEDAASRAHESFGGEMWSWKTVFDADWSQSPVPHGMDHGNMDNSEKEATPSS